MTTEVENWALGEEPEPKNEKDAGDAETVTPTASPATRKFMDSLRHRMALDEAGQELAAQLDQAAEESVTATTAEEAIGRQLNFADAPLPIPLLPRELADAPQLELASTIPLPTVSNLEIVTQAYLAYRAPVNPGDPIFLPDDPRLVGVPHDEWRGEQRTAADMALNSKEFFRVAELPTGVGKSGIAAAMRASGMKLTALVHTIPLGYQYEKYGFKFVAGRDHYECALEEKQDEWRARGQGIPTAAHCHFETMADCPAAAQCGYYQAKLRALASQKMVCTYQYGILSPKVQDRTGFLIGDEVHSSVEALLNFTEVQVTDRHRQEYDLPDFPFMASGYGPKGEGDLMTKPAQRIVERWLVKAMNRLAVLVNDPWRDTAKIKSLFDRLKRLAGDLDFGHWFLRAGPQACRSFARGVEQLSPGIFVRALDARPIASRLWRSKQAALFMSATIGDPSALMSELGVRDYDWHAYDHPTPTDYRPVFDLGCERMNATNIKGNPELINQQAARIAAFIQSYPAEWRGLVLASSHDKVQKLTYALGKLLPGRMFSPPGRRVNENIEAYLRDKRKGLISVATIQGWGHGVSLDGDLGRFTVVASVPHENPYDPYTRARKARPGGGNYALSQAYLAVVQGCGRTSRGERTATGEWELNVAALADGGATTKQAQRYFPKWFAAAIRPWKAA